MLDPRIDELLANLDETNSRGNPTRHAQMAGEVQSYLVEIEKIRSEVEIATRQVVALAGREAALKKALSARAEGASGDDARALATNNGAGLLIDDEPDEHCHREASEY